MPIRPPAMTYRCPACGWSKTVHPRSDALMPGDFYDSCPNCQHAKLEMQQASLGSQLLGWLSKATGNSSSQK